MAEENPYAVSETIATSRPGMLDPSLFYVDGTLIMSGPAVDLPAICVHTGETEDLAVMKKRLVIVPPWAYIGLIGGLIPVLVLYMILRKECLVTYHLSRKVRNRLRWRLFFGVMAIFSSPVVMVVGGQSAYPEIGVGAGVLLFLGSLVLFHLGSAPLAIKRQEKGRTFWLKGCQPGFFDRLREQYAAE